MRIASSEVPKGSRIRFTAGISPPSTRSTIDESKGLVVVSVSSSMFSAGGGAPSTALRALRRPLTPSAAKKSGRKKYVERSTR